MERSFKDYLIVTLKGLAMGAADVVPGVSGGTIAFISGIYEELISAINNVSSKALKTLKKEGFAAMWKTINGNFLLALLTGIAISILSLAKLIKWLLENETVLLWSFFFGLVLASIFFVGKQIGKWYVGTVFMFILGAALAYYITTLRVLASEKSGVYLVLAGAIAICAMILPGISGSFILLLLGAYKTAVDAIEAFDIKTIFYLAVGGLIGLLSFSRILKWLFDHYKNLTLAALTGFILGSLNKIWPWKKVLDSEVIHGKVKVLSEVSVLPTQYEGDAKFLYAIMLMIVGVLVILALERSATKKTA